MKSDQLLSRLTNGNFSDIVPDVQAALTGRGQSTLAYKISKLVCCAFLKKTGTTCPPSKQCVLHTFRACCQAILEDHEGNSPIPVNSTFIRCVFNILHSCYKEGDPEIGVHVLECSLPTFERMKSSMLDEDVRIVKRTFSVLFEVLKSSKHLFKNEAMIGVKEEFTVNSLWSLMLCLNNVTDFQLGANLDILRVMFKNYQTNQISKQYLIDFFLGKLKDIALLCKRVPKKDLVKPTKINEEYEKLIAMLHPFISTCMQCESFSNIIFCIDLVSSCLSCLYPPRSVYLHCWKLAEKIIKLLIFSTKKLPEVKHFLHHLEECVDDLEKCTKFETEAEALNLTVCWLCKVLDLLNVYWSSHWQELSIVFSPSVIITFKKLADGLSKVAERSECSVCTTLDGKSCPSKTDFLLTSTPVRVAALLVKLYSSKSPRSEELRKVFFDAIDTLESLARQAREEGCSKSSKLFRCLSHLCGRMAETYRDSEEFVIAKDLAERATRSLLCLSNEELAATSSTLYVCSHLASDCKEINKKDESKVAILLPVLLNHQKKSDNYCRQLWVKLQEKEEKGSSVMDFIRKENALIQALYPSFQVKNVDVSQLLLWELSCYASFRLSRSNQIWQAWLTLRDSNPAPLDLLHGATLFLKAILHCGSAKDLTSVLNSMSREFSEEMLIRLGKGKDPFALCLLAARTFYHFLNLHAQHALICEETTKQDHEVNSVVPVKILTHADVPNPDDTSNVKLAYNHLLLEHEAELLSFLDSAIILWEKSLLWGLGLKECNNDEIVAACSEDIVLAAFMYKLFGDCKGAIRAWQLCQSYGERMGRDDLQLQAYSGLMNLVKCLPKWISRADELAENLMNDPKHKHLLDMYYNSKAFNALHTNNFKEGVTMLQMGGKSEETSSKHVWLKIQRNFLLAQYSILRKSVVDSSVLGPLITEYEAYTGIQLGAKCIRTDLSVFTDPTYYIPVADQLLSLSLWLGRLYLWTKVPRLARCFLKAELKVAQKLGLATRVLEFLEVLAEVDICVENVDDARSTVTDIEIILGLEGKAHEVGSSDVDLGSTPEKALITHCKNGKLNVPPNNLNCAASPALQRPVAISMPDFTEHPTICMCFICKNVTVLIIYVLVTHIKAQLETLCFNVHGAHRGYRVVGNLTDFVSKKIKMFSWTPLQHYHDLICAKVAVHIAFADMLALYKKDIEAFEKNSATLELLNKLHIPELHLPAEAIQQRMCLMQMCRDDKESSKKGNSVLNALFLTPEKVCGGNAVFKTPPNVSELNTPKVGRRKPLTPITPCNQLPSRFNGVYDFDDDDSVSGQKENKFHSKFLTPTTRVLFGSKLKKKEEDSGASVKTVSSRLPVRINFEDPVPDIAPDAPKSSKSVRKKTNPMKDSVKPSAGRVTRSRTRVMKS